MRIAWTRPLTAPRSLTPPGFETLLAEAELSIVFRRFVWAGAASEYLARLWLAVYLLRLRHRYDVIVTGRYGELYAALQSLLPGRRPHLLLDIEWPGKAAPGLHGVLQRWLRRRIVRGASAVQVFCHVEADNYARLFGVDRSKFVWIPYCTDRPAPLPDEPRGEYLLSAGVHQRDYATLWQTAAGLPVEVRVAAPPAALPSDRPANVTVLGPLAPAEYARQLAGCRLFVLSLDRDVARRPGVISYVTAMQAGRCVVVNDEAGAASYIEHGRTGFLVRGGDPAALRAQIETLLAQPALADEVAAGARETAGAAFSAERFSAIVSEIVQKLA